MTKYLNILLFALLACCLGLTAQTKVHVATKTILKTFDCNEQTILNINGEKASIKITPSADNKIRIKVQLVSKNTRADLAREEIQYCDLKTSSQNNKIEIANVFIENEGFRNITSNLSARFEIEIPENLQINIRNVFGETDIRNVRASITANSSYGQLCINNISGTISINSYYCDIKGSTINASLTATAQQADIELLEVNNDCTITNKYGHITLQPNESRYINLDCNMTAITLNIKHIEDYSFIIKAHEGKIFAPEILMSQLGYRKNTNQIIHSFGKLSIKAITTYNNITINTK